MNSFTALFKPAPKVNVYLTTKKQIEGLVSNTDGFVNQYKSKFTSAEDKKVLAKQIEVNIKVVEDLVGPLADTVDDKDTSQDAQAKRTFVATTRSKLRLYANTIQLSAPPTSAPSNNKRALMDMPATTTTTTRKNYVETPVNNNSDEEFAMLMADQKRLMAEQDELLDALLPSISQLKHIGVAMHTELELQNNLLNKLDTEVDKANIKLNQTNKRTMDIEAYWCIGFS